MTLEKLALGVVLYYVGYAAGVLIGFLWIEASDWLKYGPRKNH